MRIMTLPATLGQSKTQLYAQLKSRLDPIHRQKIFADDLTMYMYDPLSEKNTSGARSLGNLICQEFVIFGDDLPSTRRPLRPNTLISMNYVTTSPSFSL
jgi:hypothetical protein